MTIRIGEGIVVHLGWTRRFLMICPGASELLDGQQGPSVSPSLVLFQVMRRPCQHGPLWAQTMIKNDTVRVIL